MKWPWSRSDTHAPTITIVIEKSSGSTVETLSLGDSCSIGFLGNPSLLPHVEVVTETSGDVVITVRSDQYRDAFDSLMREVL